MTFALYIALGFVSLLLQITVLRELLTVFSGNELDIGITLALWLLSVGLGSYTGSRVTNRHAFGASFLVVAILAVPTALGIQFIRPVLGLELGESASLGATFLSTAVTLFPLCFSLGLQFPLAVLHLKNSSSGERATGRLEGHSEAPAVYGLEALGAFLGGLLFTFVISGRVGPYGLLLFLSIMYVLLGSLVLKRQSLLLTVLLPLAIYFIGMNIGEKSVGGAEVVERVQSRYGEILLTRREGQFNLYSAGHFLFSYPDPLVDERNVHLTLSVHPAPSNILAIGGSPGRMKEFLKYDPARVDFVEIDPVLMEVSVGMLGEEDRRALEDQRIRTVIEDGRRYIKSLGRAEYDMVILNLAAPSTANMNRFYTVQFFEEVHDVLREGGILSLTLPTSAGYVSRRMQLANGSIFNSLKTVFRYAEVSTEEYGYFFASDRPITTKPEVLAARFGHRQMKTVNFHPYILEDVFSPLRVELHRERLARVTETNSDLRPAAYLYNLMLWADIHGARALNAVLGLKGYTAVVLFAIFIAYAAFVRKKRRLTLQYSILTTGYAAMAFMLAAVLGYQAAYGYVYEMFGLLSALFMVGVALGSFLMRRVRVTGLVALEGVTALFAASSFIFFGSEAMFYLFSVLAGAITGCQFAAVNRCMSEGEPARAGGMFYAFDLAGSFAGATLTAIIFVPLLGIKAALLIVSGLKVVSAFMVYLVRDE